MNIKNPCSPVLTRLHRHCDSDAENSLWIFISFTAKKSIHIIHTKDSQSYWIGYVPETTKKKDVATKRFFSHKNDVQSVAVYEGTACSRCEFWIFMLQKRRYGVETSLRYC